MSDERRDDRPSFPRPQPPAVVLVRPREEGNVGAACRAMANMGLDTLLLVEPAAEIGTTGRAFAVGARHVLEGARRHGSLEEALGPYRRVVGTTSARDRKLGVPVVTPRELPAQLAGLDATTGPLPTALVFGSEVGGLTNEELALCHLVVTVPCAPEQPTLNLAQAVLVVAYELFTAAGAEPLAETAIEPPATAGETAGLFDHLDGVLRTVGFARDSTYEGVLRDLRQMAGRARPTGREVKLLRGMLRRTPRALERTD